jgi:aspartate ammonia-lyase
MRVQTDELGSVSIPSDSLGGIATERAQELFSIAKTPIHESIICAMGEVKLACLRTNRNLTTWSPEKFSAMETAALEVAEGMHNTHCRIDSLQGGAGTATNLNINEVIANRACVLLGKSMDDWKTVHPFEDVNLHQSTNDTFPTAVKIAALRKLGILEQSLIKLVDECQKKEREFADVVKIGRTEFQDAVLTTLGRSFGAFADAFARDRWRVEKNRERLRVVNLGGTAIGTGLGAPRQYIFRVVDELRTITNLPLARAENLLDATQNCDAFVEVMGIQKVLATNLFKVANDLRLLSSGPDAGFGEIQLPAVQTGSSIMPGKINPVVPESVMQACILCMGHEQALSLAAAMGSLELNAFLPLIAHSLLHSLDLLINASDTLASRCINGITANKTRCAQHVNCSSATATALVPIIGYEAASKLAHIARSTGKSIREIATNDGFLSESEFDCATSAECATRLGSPRIFAKGEPST